MKLGSLVSAPFRRLAHRRGRGERGVTIVEMMATLTILSAVLGITLSFLNGSSSVLGSVEDTTEGLRDVNILTNRLSQDLRNARSVNSTATTDNLTIWIDYNSDYIQTTDETINWSLVPGSTPGQFDAIRTTGTGVSEVLGSTLIEGVLFYYDAVDNLDTFGAGEALDPRPVETTQVVGMKIKYDAIVNAYATQKTVLFRVRLRNVE